ncbi:MAG: hypothetical protein GY953_05315, partial [bacterium]|nr:hypothetical protein [bacterium]
LIGISSIIYVCEGDNRHLQSSVLPLVYEQWADSDPDAAIAFAAADHRSLLAGWRVGNLLTHLLNTAPKAATRIAESLPPEHAFLRTSTEVLAVALDDPAAAMRRLGTGGPSSQFLALLQDDIVDAALRTDKTAELTRLFTAEDGHGLGEMPAPLLHRWFSEDPDAAI